jgi:hypothetical protein
LILRLADEPLIDQYPLLAGGSIADGDAAAW